MAYTLATLKTAIQDYTQNTETTFVSQLPRFIINAEERIFKEVQLDVFRKYQTGTLSASVKFLTKPDDYLSSMSLSVIEDSKNKFLLYKHVTFLQDYTPNPATTGTPLYYGDWNSTSLMEGEEALLSVYNGRFQEAIRWLKNLGEGRDTRDQYRYDRVRREVE